jgi:hypothetical protein
MRAVAREIGVFAFFVVLAIVFTWPLAIRLPTATSDLGDPILNAWIIDWDLYATVHAPSHIYQAPMFYPARYPLAYSENLFGIALVALPFYLAGCSPLVIYNLMLVLGFAFCGYGAYVLVRVATGSLQAGIISGVLYAFVPFRLDHMPHVQVIWGGWLPLILAGILHYWKRSTWWTAAGFGAALLMNGLTNIHYFLFGTLSAAITIFVLAVVEWRHDWRFWMRLAIAGALAVGLMIPVLWPYKVVSQLYEMKRKTPEVTDGSATWTDWLTPPFRSRTYGNLIPSEKTADERHLFPGLFALFLTAAAFVLYDALSPQAGRGWREASSEGSPRRLRIALRAMDVAIVALAIISYWGAISPKFILRLGNIRVLSVNRSDLPFTALLVLLFIRLWIQRPIAWRNGLKRLPVTFWIGCLWIAIGLLGSFGVHGFFHSMLYERVEAFQAIRVPARWASIAYVGLAVTAGFGAVSLMRRRATVAFAVLLAMAIFDMRPSVRWQHANPEIDPVYVWIRDAPFHGAVLELPLEENDAQFLYLLSQTFHHRPILNGFSGFFPPTYSHLYHLTSQKRLDRELTAYIERLGTSVLVVHDDWLGTQGKAVHDWLRGELAAGRLVFLRRFDHRTGGDFVFAVRANCPDCVRLRPPDRPDTAGLLPDQNLERMLRGEPTYVGHAFGYLDFPRQSRVEGGQLTVSGWALSPDGISGVDVLLHSATVRYRAALTDRGDVQARFPWYPRVERAGFALTIPKRPRGLPSWTDIQVEIIDSRGVRTRLPDRFLEW